MTEQEIARIALDCERGVLIYPDVVKRLLDERTELVLALDMACAGESLENDEPTDVVALRHREAAKAELI